MTKEKTNLFNLPLKTGGLTDKTYQQAELLFDKQTIIATIMAVTTINAWNRIAISTKMK